MSLCYITLSWEDDSGSQLPAGAYIEYGGNVYRLLEPYNPTYVNEASWRYTPQFYDKIAIWSKKPLFLVTDSGEETDWSLTAYPGQFMEAVVAAIQEYTGETYTYSVDASIAQLSMQNVTFQNVSIFDGLTKIANAWNTEWWVSGNVIHLSKCQYGTEITLTVGDNIGIPNVTKNKDGYFTRFYAFGGTRNITQDYNDSGFTNGLVNKRLTLSPTDYPGGYIDIKPNLQQAEIFVKTLIFDDIYPSSSLTISDVRVELKDYINEDGSKIQIGEDAEGNPLYQQYAIWYFKIPEFDFNNSTYDKEDNPDGMLLPGLALSVSFESGQLNGRDFELIYHDDTSEYEIKFVTEGTLIVPGTVSLIPADGDSIILYNIKMPSEYTSSAQDDLADALLAEMDKYKKDRNSYTFPSASDKFESGNLDMNVGQSVNFVRGSQSLSTRVLKVEKQIDYPIEQTITVGEEKIKGNTQEIKEEIIDANQNIDIATELANLSKAITDGYGRVQQLIMQSISQYRGLWYLDQHNAPNDPTKWTINTDYTAFSAGDVVAYATAPFDQLEPQLPVASDYNTTGLFRAKQGGGLLYDSAANAWYVDPDFQGSGGIDESQLAAYLTKNNYVTQKYLTDNGYLKLSSPLTGYQKPSGYSPITATDTLLTAIGKLEANFGNYVDLTTNQKVGGVKTFTERILSQKDVVCYASADEGDLGLPVTGYSTTGLVRIKDGGGIVVDSSGVISVDPDYAGGGGVNFTPGNALQLTSSGVLNVLIGTTSGTVCAGNDSRLTTAYNQSHTHSNKSVLDGITSGYVSNWNTAYNLSHSHSNKSVLDGISSSDVSHWDNAYNNAHWHTNKSYLDVINQNLSTGSSVTFLRVYISDDGGTWRMQVEPSGRLSFALGSTTKAYIDNSNIVSMGDVVAYGTGSTLSDFVPVATTSTYGLVRYDGSTIGKNSSGQLYVISGSSGGGGSSVSWGTSSGNTIYLYVDGVSERLVLASGITVSGSGSQYRTVNLVGAELDLSLNGHTHSQYLTSLSRSTTGSGNVVTNVTVSGSTITVSYGNVSGGGTSVAWGADTGNTVYLSVAGTQKQLVLASGITVSNTSSSQYRSVKLVGANMDLSIYGHTHSQYLTSVSLSRSTSGSGNVVSDVTVSGSRITVYYKNISTSGGSWNGGTVSNAIQCPYLRINTSSSSYRLAVNGASNFNGQATFTVVAISGNCLIGTSSSSYKLAVNGNVVVTGRIDEGSDIRFKTIVSDVTGILEHIVKTRVFRYYWKGKGDLKIGVSAQDVKEWMPEVVGYDINYYTLNYSSFATACAIQGIKELYTRFRPVESKVKMLEQQVRNLQLRLDNAYREIFELKEGGTAA